MIYAEIKRPVTIVAGLGLPRQIGSVSEAIMFLNEYPFARRDEAYDATVEACRDALAGKVSEAQAMETFTALARRHGYLLADIVPDDLVPSDRRRGDRNLTDGTP